MRLVAFTSVLWVALSFSEMPYKYMLVKEIRLLELKLDAL